MSIPFRALLVACSLCAFFAQIVSAADQVGNFNLAKRNLQQLMRSKQPADRLSAIKGFEKFPLAESVRLLHGGLFDGEESVREAAYAALVRMSANQEVCDTLMALARKSIARRDDAAAAPAFAAVLASPLPSVRRDSIEFVDGIVSETRGGEQIVVTLADELGAHRAAIDVLPLARLSQTKAFADHFGVRRATVAALCRIRTSEAIGALVDMLGKLGGEDKADAVEHLTEVTGQIFAMDADAWGRWWQDSQRDWKYPVRSTQTPYRSVAMSTSSEYYGMPLFAQRLVFVLDTSGSMTGPRIVAAKRELARAIDGLAGNVHFGVVVFNGSVAAWQRELVEATSQHKRAAITFVNNQNTHSNTASYDALEAALEFDTEAIYFLSDGAPFGGKITAPADIVTAIGQINKTRRVSIYTIGIGAGMPGGPLDMFLKTLAEQNLGLYRRIDG